MIMAKHLEALERENGKLRVLLSQRNEGVTLPPRPSLELSPLNVMPLKQRTPRRMIKKERNESDASPFESLYLSEIGNPSFGMNMERMLDIPPLSTINNVRSSKRLRLM